MPETPASDPAPAPGPSAAQSPANVVPAHSPQPIIIQTHTGSSGSFFRLFALLGWLGFVMCAIFVIVQLAMMANYFDTTGGITAKYYSGKKMAASKVAIISVTGLIATGEGFVKQQIDKVQNDESVKAVVLRINSPGGTVTGSDYMFHYLTKLRKERGIPIIVSMGSIATSGGYYVAMAVGDQEQAIYAEPTTTTGSIGVIIPHYDISGLLKRFDVKDDSIATNPRKMMLAMTRPIPEDHRKLIEEYLNESFTRFKDIVKRGRPKFRKDPEALDRLATGEVFTATQAKANGLIDEIGFLEEAIDRAIELAGLDAANTSVIRYQRPASLFALSGLAHTSSQSELSDFFELNTPRAYYLASTLPPLMATYSKLLNDR